MAGDSDGPGVVTLGEDDRAATLAAVKAMLRIAVDDEDALIAGFVEAALGLAEGFIGQVMIARTIVESVPARRDWRPLAAMPVSVINAVTGIDPAGSSITLAGTTAIDIDGEARGWVRLTGASAAVRLVVTLEAGLAARWADLPAPIAQGVILLAAYLYEQRDAAGAPPAAVTALWRPFRRMRLAERAPA